VVEEENKRNREIIDEYKLICRQLSERLEKNSNSSRDELEAYQVSVICNVSTFSILPVGF